MFCDGAAPAQAVHHNQFFVRNISSDAASSHEQPTSNA
jgi:hypothetical protein